jgi:hypothetical protein
LIATVSGGVIQFHIAILFAALGKYLDAVVDAEHMVLVFGELVPVQIDGRGSGHLGLRGHVQLLWGRIGALVRGLSAGCGKEECECGQRYPE